MLMFSTLTRWITQYPVVTAACWLQVALAALAVVAMPFDQRQILGLNPWIKPLKFNVSIAIVLLTGAAFLAGLERFEGARTWTGNALAVALGIESVLITLQAGRGVRSHMNYATSFDAYVSMGMGVMAAVATLAAAWILVLTFIAQPRWSAAAVWGARLGLLMFLAGSFEGTLMFKAGAHTIGAADGGPGLPLTNWSLKHGDLRIAHFFALHALQAFPLFGYVCSRTSWREGIQVSAVFLFVALYTAGVWFLFRLAMQGRPLLFAA